MSYGICYVSTLNTPLNSEEIKQLFDSFTTKNIAQGISGILLHNSGNFLQYFEGNKNDIKDLYYSKIKKDTRHKNIITLFEKDVNEQYFTGYEAGFTSIIEKNQIKNLKAYLKLLKYLDSSEMKMLSNTVNSFFASE